MAKGLASRVFGAWRSRGGGAAAAASPISGAAADEGAPNGCIVARRVRPHAVQLNLKAPMKGLRSSSLYDYMRPRALISSEGWTWPRA